MLSCWVLCPAIYLTSFTRVVTVTVCLYMSGRIPFQVKLYEAVFKAGCLVAGDIGERDLPPLSAPIKHPSFTGFLMPGTCRSFKSPHECTSCHLYTSSCQLHVCTSLICDLMPGTFRLFTSPHASYMCVIYTSSGQYIYRYVIYTASCQVHVCYLYTAS